MIGDSTGKKTRNILQIGLAYSSNRPTLVYLLLSEKNEIIVKRKARTGNKSLILMVLSKEQFAAGYLLPLTSDMILTFCIINWSLESYY